MLLLTSTSDLLRIVTGQAVTTDVHASYVDINGSTVTPGRANTPITTATTTTVVASPGASTYRTVKTLFIRNRHAASTQDVTVLHSDGTNVMELIKVTLGPGETLHYDEGAGFVVKDSSGGIKQREASVATVLSAINIVVLGADVTNNNGVANTIQDITGLSFPVVAGQTYWFEFIIPYTSAATTTGSRWTISGPAAPTMLNYRSEYSLTATSVTVNCATAYDIPAAANATSLTAGNIATIWGVITPSAGGTVIGRFASEILSSAIVAKAGATLRWIRVV